ncbi:MAG: EamA family transporter [Colwelliaceae bacterium]|nr:EamA family transporter [Colwelliaceae bacterium]
MLSTKNSFRHLELISTTCLALIAFAANSVLCRLALKDELIDPAGFTIIRLVSAAAMFAVLLTFTNKKPVKLEATETTKEIFDETELQPTKLTNSLIKSLRLNDVKLRCQSALSLFAYAIAFSYAYTLLDAASGALILFGSVQLTMIVASFRSGHRLKPLEWLGIALSFGGLAYLMLPSASSPSITGFALMAVSGIAWGIYTLSGKQSRQPFLDTAHNFLLTLPFVVLLGIITLATIEFTSFGALYALLSGVLASALGYTLWFKALPSLTATEAGVLQLSVPIITAIAGAILLSEAITLPLVISSTLVLGGIALVIIAKR